MPSRISASIQIRLLWSVSLDEVWEEEKCCTNPSITESSNSSERDEAGLGVSRRSSKNARSQSSCYLFLLPDAETGEYHGDLWSNYEFVSLSKHTAALSPHFQPESGAPAKALLCSSGSISIHPHQHGSKRTHPLPSAHLSNGINSRVDHYGIRRRSLVARAEALGRHCAQLSHLPDILLRHRDRLGHKRPHRRSPSPAKRAHQLLEDPPRCRLCCSRRLGGWHGYRQHGT